MTKDPNFPQNFSMEQAMAFAASPAGQQLLSMLQQTGGSELNSAREQAAAGDMEQAKQTLSQLLNDPKIKALLKQFGG